jgi:peptidoglycan-N-acetylglucosamine deacetylase
VQRPEMKDFYEWDKSEWPKMVGKELPHRLKQNLGPGRRLGIMLTFDTQGDIDGGVRHYQGGTTRWNDDHINYYDMTQRMYDIRAGVPRILRLLDRYGIKSTFPTTGTTAEWYPDTVAAIAAAGHEVAVHGYRHVLLPLLNDEQEREEIVRARDALKHVLGSTPVGWRSPMYSTTNRTVKLLTELGFSYMSDFHNDDKPYILENGGKKLVHIPAGLDDWEMNIMKVPGGISMGGQPYASPSHVADILIGMFEVLYSESVDEPQVIQFTMHPKVSGRPDRTYGVEMFIRHVQGRPGVFFTTMKDLAAMCL